MGKANEKANGNGNQNEDAPPAYTEDLGETSETTPLIQPQVITVGRATINIEGIQPVYPVPLQVVVASTNQPVPIRIKNGELFLTVLEPVRMFCPHCNQVRTTVLSSQAKYCAYASCVVMCVFCQPFCFLPFCLKECKEQIHSCEHCDHILATVVSA